MKFTLTIQADNLAELQAMLDRLSPGAVVSEDEDRVTAPRGQVAATIRMQALKAINQIGRAAKSREVYRTFRKLGFKGEFKQVDQALYHLVRLGLVERTGRKTFAPISRH